MSARQAWTSSINFTYKALQNSNLPVVIAFFVPSLNFSEASLSTLLFISSRICCQAPDRCNSCTTFLLISCLLSILIHEREEEKKKANLKDCADKTLRRDTNCFHDGKLPSLNTFNILCEEILLRKKEGKSSCSFVLAVISEDKF